MVDLIAAPFTAFDNDGSVNLDAIPGQVERLRADGVAGAFVCGTTGESSSLTADERAAIAATWLEHRSGLEIIVHVGHANVGEARRLATQRKALAHRQSVPFRRTINDPRTSTRSCTSAGASPKPRRVRRTSTTTSPR